MTRREETLRPAAPQSPNFLDTLSRVLGMARRAETSSEFLTEFRSELQALPPRSQARLSVLLNIGREAHGLARRTAVSPKDAVSPNDTPPLDVLALCDTSTLSQRYLERGLAAACAGKLTLDTAGNDGFKADQRLSVYERAWSRFGKALASSEPGEWSWFACHKGRSRMLDKLYVRHGNSAWWSFSAGIDRPLREQIDVDRKRATSSRLSSEGTSLESLLTREGSPSRRGLLRALMSVHARLGKVGAA